MLTGTRRTVLMLAGCQALSMTGGSIVGLTGAIVGNMLNAGQGVVGGAKLTGQLLAFARKQHLAPRVVPGHRLAGMEANSR